MSRRLVIFALVFSPAAWLGLAALVMAACKHEAGEVRLSQAPAWIQPTDERMFTDREIVARALLETGYVQVRTWDARYSLVSRDWVERYTEWTWSAAKAVGIRYTPESFDCEDFAALFVQIAKKKAAEAGVQTSPLIGTIVVTQDNGTHALVLVATDRGLLIIEPQPVGFRIRPAANYRGRVVSITL